ncbi:DUF4298 domain-containing protein [Streptococcus cameli]
MTPEEQARVEELEAKYDRFQPVLEQVKSTLAAFQSAYRDYQELRTFYGSEEWYDLREKPHEKVKAGVLSEDQLYDLIVEHNDLLGQFLELANQMYKDM